MINEYSRCDKRIGATNMTTWHERKKKRKEYFEKNVKGWKLRPCIACNGSGKYDHNGSPKCGACNGTGKERFKANGICCKT